MSLLGNSLSLDSLLFHDCKNDLLTDHAILFQNLSLTRILIVITKRAFRWAISIKHEWSGAPGIVYSDTMHPVCNSPDEHGI